MGAASVLSQRIICLAVSYTAIRISILRVWVHISRWSAPMCIATRTTSSLSNQIAPWKGRADQLKPLAILSFLVACLSVLAYFFNLFAPVVYGHDEDDAKFPNSSLHHLHLLDQWDF